MKKLLYLALASLFFAACQKEDTSVDKARFDERATGQKAPEKQARPLSGNLNNAPVPGITPLDCGSGVLVSGKNFLYGTISHMGRLNVSSFGIAQECFLSIGKITYKEIWVAANGDELYSDSYVFIVPDPVIPGVGTFTGEGIITGGTGRFDGASGKWNHTNGKYFADGTSTWSIIGEIIY